MGTVAHSDIVVKLLGKQEYHPVWQEMQRFTQTRHCHTRDELWVVEHPPVFTQGRSGKDSHILNKSNIPIIKVDRGGQVTYHGPGQLVIYFLLDLHRRKLGIRQLVTLIEDSLVDLLTQYNIDAYSDKKAPGVYVNKQKIAALGLRVSKGCTTHGLSLNIDMDLSPFQDINPCGYENLEITQCKDLGIKDDFQVLTKTLLNLIIKSLEKP